MTGGWTWNSYKNKVLHILSIREIRWKKVKDTPNNIKTYVDKCIEHIS